MDFDLVCGLLIYVDDDIYINICVIIYVRYNVRYINLMKKNLVIN